MPPPPAPRAAPPPRSAASPTPPPRPRARPPRHPLLASLLLAATRTAAAQDSADKLFIIDPAKGGLANNPGLIVFIVLMGLLTCSCAMCAVGFAKFDWLRVLVFGTEPTEVDLLGPPPPEPQGGRGNWVVRPRMETAFEEEGSEYAYGAPQGKGGVVGGARGSGGPPDALAARGSGASSAWSSEGGGGGGGGVPEVAAAAAWLELVRPGRPRLQPPAAPGLPPLPSDRAPSSERSSRRSSRRRGSSARYNDGGGGGDSASVSVWSDEEAASDRARSGRGARSAPPVRADTDASATSAGSWWSRRLGGASQPPSGRWLAQPPATSARSDTSASAPMGSLWASMRNAGGATASQPPPAPLRAPPSDVLEAAAWLAELDAPPDGSSRGGSDGGRRGRPRAGR